MTDFIFLSGSPSLRMVDGRPANMTAHENSEYLDAFRMTLYEERARLDYGSVADQVKRGIESMSDQDLLEPLFVY